MEHVFMTLQLLVQYTHCTKVTNVQEVVQISSESTNLTLFKTVLTSATIIPEFAQVSEYGMKAPMKECVCSELEV